ncbi:DUF2971 domain-containing protein [Bacillus atrophaeus]|uniref:DUF2971 domain-containing protein n=1 Tax=Bacillus atrophaeus TaxID=1452 RepID=UPI0022811D89|nr:DUF2971 domain-containing protein [Bacillus atrophaeus]MCY8950017.1 DUF2971 domain-containing protein [Bacillus atrophaeus]
MKKLLFHECSREELSIQRDLNKILMDEPSEPIPDRLYHYTSINGLEGILKSKQFWVTHFGFLNDQTELYYTYDLCKKIIFEMSNRDSKTYELILKFLNPYLFEFDQQIYILSLTTNMDSNLLWSNYANNDGYNIALDYPRLLEEFRSNDEGKKYEIRINKVVYDRDEQEKYLKKLISCIFRLVEYHQITEKTEKLPENFESFIIVISIFISLFASFCKDSAFSQEEEVRVIFQKRHNFSINTDFRISNGSFIPYIKMPFTTSGKIIKGITVGPKNKMDIAEKGMELFLKAQGYDYIDDNAIVKSRIPYRY